MSAARRSAPPGASARLFALAAALAAGALVAEAPRPGPVLIVGLALAVTALALARGHRAVVLLVAAFAVGGALAGSRIAAVEGGAIARGGLARADAVLEGEVLGEPLRTGDAVRFVLAVRRASLDGHGFIVRERAWVSVRPPAPVGSGDLLRVHGRLRPLAEPGAGPAQRASARRLLRRGAGARAFTSPDGVEVVGRTGNPLARVANAGRAAVRRAAARLPARDAGLLLGLTVGDTSRLDPEDELAFRQTGLSHLLAVSGANVAMVVGAVALLLRFAGAGRRATVGALLVIVVAFMAVTRFEPSVMRAGAMASIGLGGLALGARRGATVALGVATLGLLAHDPFLVHSVGFQLSVLATAGILAVSPRIAERLPPGRLAALAAVTLGAQLAVVPLLVLHFHQVSLASIAANLVAVPLVAPATIAGIAGAALGSIWSPLGAVALVAQPPIAGMRFVARALAELPLASLGTPRGALGLVLAAVLALVAIAVARGPARGRLAPLGFALALFVTGGVWARAAGPPPLSGLVVTMLDVGQGDAIAVRAGGRTMLVDGGPDGGLALRTLRSEGVRRIDLLVATHPHLDHVAGLAAVAERLPVGRAIDPAIPSELPEHAALLAALRRRGVPVDRARAGLSYHLGPAVVDVLWPPPRHLQATDEDVNNNSIVLRVRYGADAVLLAGETQEESQAELLRRPQALRAGVLKVSHHGSRRMLPDFYRATRARVALIPVGPNTFGHPAAETLHALAGMQVLRTDGNGTVSVALDGRGRITLRSERGSARSPPVLVPR